MGVRLVHGATDRKGRSMDWTTIGARIVQAAIMASDIHLAERVRMTHDGPAVEEAGAAYRGRDE